MYQVPTYEQPLLKGKHLWPLDFRALPMSLVAAAAVARCGGGWRHYVKHSSLVGCLARAGARQAEHAPRATSDWYMCDTCVALRKQLWKLACIFECRHDKSKNTSNQSSFGLVFLLYLSTFSILLPKILQEANYMFTTSWWIFTIIHQFCLNL